MWEEVVRLRGEFSELCKKLGGRVISVQGEVPVVACFIGHSHTGKLEKWLKKKAAKKAKLVYVLVAEEVSKTKGNTKLARHKVVIASKDYIAKGKIKKKTSPTSTWEEASFKIKTPKKHPLNPIHLIHTVQLV